MKVFEALDDHEVDALLSGAPGGGELAPIADVARALRLRTDLEPVPPMSAALRAQLAQAPVVGLDPRRAARSRLTRAAAVAAAAAVVAMGGAGVAAAQNRLPTALQDIVSSAADAVGLHVPSSGERSQGDEHRSETADDHARNETAPNADQGGPGHEGTTPGGATPADPGTPGDKEPATPATPPDQGNAGSPPTVDADGDGTPDGSTSSGGGGQGQGSNNGQGQDGSTGQGQGSNSGQGSASGNAYGNGTSGSTGNATGGGNGNDPANASEKPVKG